MPRATDLSACLVLMTGHSRVLSPPFHPLQYLAPPSAGPLLTLTQQPATPELRPAPPPSHA